METRVILIGQGLFLDGLTHILSEQSSLDIIAAVPDWETAHRTLTDQKADIIIVDHADAELRDRDLAPLLENNFPTIKVIYLTLADSKMVIHDRRQISGATLDDLLQALQSPGTGDNPTL